MPGKRRKPVMGEAVKVFTDSAGRIEDGVITRVGDNDVIGVHVQRHEETLAFRDVLWFDTEDGARSVGNRTAFPAE